MTTARTEAMRSGIADLRERNEFCDFEISCGTYSFKVHKVVLAAQSGYFQTVFKAGRFKEGQESKISFATVKTESQGIDDASDDPELVKIMVGYFYEHDYKLEEAGSATTKPVKATPSKALHRGFRPTVGPKPYVPVPKSRKRPFADDPIGAEASGDDSTKKTKSKKSLTLALDGNTDTQLMMHAAVFAMATKYQVIGLQQLAAEKFQAALRTGWNHASVAQVIPFVFASTPDTVPELRDIVIAALLSSKKLAERPEVEAAVSSIDSLAYTLFKRKF